MVRAPAFSPAFAPAFAPACAPAATVLLLTAAALLCREGELSILLSPCRQIIVREDGLNEHGVEVVLSVPRRDLCRYLPRLREVDRALCAALALLPPSSKLGEEQQRPPEVWPPGSLHAGQPMCFAYKQRGEVRSAGGFILK